MRTFSRWCVLLCVHMRIMRIVPILLMLLFLGACASPKKTLKPNELVKFDPSHKLKSRWNKSAGKGQKKKIYSRFSPAISHDKIFVADYKGNVFAYAVADTLETHKSDSDLNENVENADLDESVNKASSKPLKSIKAGQKLWAASLDKKISAALGADKYNVYLGSQEGEIMALNALTGQLSWTHQLSSEITAIPASNGEAVVVTTIDGGVYTFDVQSGEKKWDYRHQVPSLTYRSSASAVLTASEAIVPFDSGQIKAMSLEDGSTSWEMRVSQPKGRTDLERVIDIDGTPVMDGGTLYAATVQGAVVAIDRSNGKVIWRQDFSTADNLTLGHGNLYGVTPDSKVVAFDAYSGAIKWQNDQLLRRGAGSLQVITDFIAVIDSMGYLHLISSDSGEFVARKQVAAKGFGSRLVVHDVADQAALYVLDRSGSLKRLTVSAIEKASDKVEEAEAITETQSNQDMPAGVNLSFDGLLGIDGENSATDSVTLPIDLDEDEDEDDDKPADNAQ